MAGRVWGFDPAAEAATELIEVVPADVEPGPAFQPPDDLAATAVMPALVDEVFGEGDVPAAKPSGRVWGGAAATEQPATGRRRVRLRDEMLDSRRHGALTLVLAAAAANRPGTPDHSGSRELKHRSPASSEEGSTYAGRSQRNLMEARGPEQPTEGSRWSRASAHPPCCASVFFSSSLSARPPRSESSEGVCRVSPCRTRT